MKHYSPLPGGASTTVEIFFAHAHSKWLIFDHFHRAGAIFLSQRHPERPPGAMQGRSFFHAAPSGPQREPAALPGCGARGWRGLAGQRVDAPNQTTATGHHWCGGRGGSGGPGCGARGRWRGLAGLREDTPISDPAPLVWRAPEGPEGTGGLRGAAPNEVRTPSLAGGRARRRPEHPWGHKQSSPAP